MFIAFGSRYERRRLPPEFELVVNLNAGKSLGLTIAQALLPRADEVIQ